MKTFSTYLDMLVIMLNYQYEKSIGTCCKKIDEMLSYFGKNFEFNIDNISVLGNHLFIYLSLMAGWACFLNSAFSRVKISTYDVILQRVLEPSG